MPSASRSSLLVTEDSPYPIKVTLYRMIAALTAFVVMVLKPIFGYTNNTIAATTVDFFGNLCALILLVVGWWESVTPKGWWDALHEDRGKLLWDMLHSHHGGPSRSRRRFTRRQGTLNRTEQGEHIALLPQGQSPVGPSNIMATARQDPSSRELGLRDRRKHISQWLSAPDPSGDYITARKKTCGRYRFMGYFRPAIRRMEDKDRLVHLDIRTTSMIIEHVTNICEADASSACALFFFVYNDSHKRTHTNLIRALISQLSAQCPDIPTSLEELYQNRDQEPSIDSLQNTLQHIINEFKQVYIFVDALDECASMGIILTWIHNITGLKAGKLHLLVTSRAIPEILEGLKNLTSYRIILGGGSMKSDLKAYLDSEIQESWLGALPEEGQLRIKGMLLERAQGMFILLSIHLKELQNSVNEAGLYEQLNRLPNTLAETYSRILARIPNQRRTAAKVCLQWTAFSSRSLRLEELGEAAAFEFNPEGVPVFNPRRKLQAQDILVACAGLVTESQGYINLVHFSVKEFLISEAISGGTVSYFGISEQLAHSYISRTCLAYLLRFDSLSSLSDETLFPLAQYAAENWVFHMRLGGNDEDHVSHNLILKLLESEARLTNWIRLWDPDQPSGGPKPTEIADPLYYASLLGFPEVLRRLLERGAGLPEGEGRRVIANRINDSKALEASSRGGYLGIVKLLLQYGANANAQGMRFDTALQAASIGGHVEIVQVLLQHSADVHGEGGKSALQAASKRGYLEIVSLLEDAAQRTPVPPQAVYTIPGRTLASATGPSGPTMFPDP